MDVLRGIALLGILIANVIAFGIPAWNYYVPLSTIKPVFHGPHAEINTILWFARWIVMEGKMRALFSLLFGAGVVLLTSRIEQREGTGKAADIFLRRNMWLVLFGVLHAYLLFFGDILYFYGIIALLFLYPCRNLKPKTLTIASVCLLAINMCVDPFSGGTPLKDTFLHRKAVMAEQAQKAGHMLSDTQKADLRAWDARKEEWKPDTEAVAGDLAAASGGFATDFQRNVPEVIAYERDGLYAFGFLDMLPLMLLGMALCKNGFLTAKQTAKTYAMTAMAGTVVSVPLVGLATWKAYTSGFAILPSVQWLFGTYDVGRVSGMLAIAGFGLFCVKKKIVPRALGRLGAVGQMALSNYLLTSLLCKSLFIWSPWKLYDRLEYYQLYFVVAGI